MLRHMNKFGDFKAPKNADDHRYRKERFPQQEGDRLECVITNFARGLAKNIRKHGLRATVKLSME